MRFRPALTINTVVGRLAVVSGAPYTRWEHTYTAREAGMKAKLTVTIDEDLIPKAKERAQSEGVSLSALIERALRGVTLEGRRSFSARWRGRFKAARRKDDRYKALAGRYL